MTLHFSSQSNQQGLMHDSEMGGLTFAILNPTTWQIELDGKVRLGA